MLNKNNIISTTIIIFFVIILLIIVFGNVILYFAKSFEKTITIKDKSILSNRNSSTYRIIDTNNNIYNIENVWFIADFNRVEDYYNVNVGGKYKINGYGFTNNALGIFPSVYKITAA